MEFEITLPIALAFLVVTVSPGPANIANALVSMRFGRRAGLSMGVGLAVGLSFWGIVAATGLGVVLQASEFVLMSLKIVGGIYLLWLAFQSWRTALKPTSLESGPTKGGRWFLRGLFLNLSNPKAVFAWMAALSMGLGGGSDGAAVLLPTLICMIIGFLNYTLYALAFSLPGFMSGYQRSQQWIDGVVGALFAAAGLGLIKSAVAR